MTNPTTNFGWQMPTPTDLVTDLPADFEVFGQAVDTDFVDLLGGTTGQILSKTSATDLDFTWINNDQGDITAVTAGTGITGGGTSGAVTITNSMATAIDAKGDLIAGTGADTFARLATGTNGQILSVDTAQATGLAWITNDVGDITAVTVTAPITGGGTSGSVGIAISAASTSASGAVQLSDSTSTTSSVLASTPTATKSAYDLAAAAIPKSTVTTNGDVIYATGSSAVTRLGIGSTGNVLTVAGGVPTWAAPAAASGFTFIRRTTFSNTAEALFDTLFTTTYETYLVVIETMTASTGADNGQLRMRRNATTSSTSGVYGMLTSAKYNDTAIQFTGKTNSDAIDISTYTDGMSAALFFNNVGTGTSVPARAHGTSQNPAQGENGLIGFVCADSQNWNGFSLKSSSSNVTGAATIYGLAKA